jgi:hypothetical protein
MTILEIVKKALLIPSEESFADEELQSYIDSYKEYLISSGVPKEVVDAETDANIKVLIIIYCKTFYGFKADGSVKELPKSFDVILNQVVLRMYEVPSVS